MQDGELLHAYAANRDESAFAELVRRHLDLVFSACLRRVEGNASLAEDAAQSVFLLVARKAPTLTDHPCLAAWLHKTATHVAGRLHRSEVRRRLREWESIPMSSSHSDESQIDQVLPLLDEALARLPEADRTAIVSRYFLKKSMRDVGAALGINEAAAKMRVSRAVHRLRELLARRGLTCSATFLGLVLADHSVRAAPAWLSKKIATRIGVLPAASFISSAVNTLILMSKTKIAIVCVLAASAGFFLLRNEKLTPSVELDQKTIGFQRHGTGNAAATKQSSIRTATPRSSGKPSPEGLAMRLRWTLALPLKDGMGWPVQEVIDAVAAFPDKRAAFEILTNAIAHPEEIVKDDPRLRQYPQNDKIIAQQAMDKAVRVMASIASDVPEVAPYLWDLTKSDDLIRRLDAFDTLKQIGFASKDAERLSEILPTLAHSPAGQRYISEAISKLIAQDPDGAAPSIPYLQNLLSDPNERIQLAAAAALAQSQLGKDPRLDDIFRTALTGTNVTQTINSSDSLARAGTNAASYLPDLRQIAASTQDRGIRLSVLRAIIAIAPAEAAEIPSAAAMLAEDSLRASLNSKLQSGTGSIDDLTAALQHGNTLEAAKQLGDRGTFASAAIPSLLQSLENHSQGDRERIVEAIHRIDPTVAVAQVPEPVITRAMGLAQVLSYDQSNSTPLHDFVMNRAMYHSWWTEDETVKFVNQLTALSPAVAAEFKGELLKRQPDLVRLFPSR